jgi:hypothetical protein
MLQVDEEAGSPPRAPQPRAGETPEPPPPPRPILIPALRVLREHLAFANSDPGRPKCAGDKSAKNCEGPS